ncbi:MAG: peptidylprolyl isomerase A [Isosphaeraceae bacterium]
MTMQQGMTWGCMAAVAALLAWPHFSVSGTAEVVEDGKPLVVLDTTLGSITLELDRAKAPITVDNFLQYVDSGFYAGTTFHRVIGPNANDPEGFMVQAGGFDEKMVEKEGVRQGIKNESGNGLTNSRGSIAMGLQPNKPDSATSQFYVNLKDNTHLDAKQGPGSGYAVFGRVVEGMDVIDKIARVKTGSKGFHQNVPVTPVVIKSAKRKPKAA